MLETENPVSPQETGSGASAVVSQNTQDKCRHKGAECFKCHKTAHLQSECPNGKFPPKLKKDRQHFCLAEDSEEVGPSDSEDSFIYLTLFIHR